MYGADFGVGVASGLLFEAVRAIWQLQEEIKANKKQAKQLATRCQDAQSELMQLFSDMQRSGLKEGPVYNAVENYALNFYEKLNRIKDSMVKWARLDVWDRFLLKGEMAGEITYYHHELMEMWQRFHVAISVQNLASSDNIHRTVRSNSVMLRAVDEWQTTMGAAKTKDDAADVEEMQGLTATINNLSVGQPDIQMQEGFTNVMENRRQIVQKFKNYPEAAEDPDVTKARNELIQALEAYEGDRPLFSIDSSELTVPIKVYQGQYATICKGVRRGRTVAIKKVNVESSMVETIYRRINRESKIWQKLKKHPNIVEFIGVCGPRNEFPYMISEWMGNGNVRKYVKENPNADCVKLCLDVSEGLAYIHGLAPPITHGGLKGTNILIDDNGVAKLTDFALASIAAEVETGSRPQPMRWSAPEVLDGEDRNPSSDIYSFGCVMIEIITERDPFPNHTHLYRLHRLVREGLRPDFPESEKTWKRGLTSPECPLWALMKACWSPRSDSRPPAMMARDKLAEIWASRQGR